MTFNYEVQIRKQHSNGSSAHQFGGPDTYVAVIATPEGVKAPKVLNRSILRMRGIKYQYIGEGYSTRCSTPRSALYRAIDRAEEMVAWKNYCEQAWSEPIR